MKKYLSTITGILLLSSISFAQFQINWQQCFCSMDGDKALDIASSIDGYIIAGHHSAGDAQVLCSQGPGGWFIGIDEVGNELWQQCHDSAIPVIIEKSNDNLYWSIGVGWLYPYPEENNLWISKIDSSGTILWERVLGNEDGASSYGGYGGFLTDDGGAIATIIIFSKGGDITNWHGAYDGWIVKVDSMGNKEWDQTIGTAGSESIDGIIKTNDNGYLSFLQGAPDGITGNISCSSTNSSDSDAIVAKLDSLGNVQWTRCYGGTDNEGAFTGVALDDGYLIAAAGSSSDGDMENAGWHMGYHHTGDRTSDIWLIRTDMEGQIIWSSCYGGSGSDSPREIFKSEDGGFIIFGNTDSHDGDVFDNPSIGNHRCIWVFKIDSIGNIQWQQCIGGHAKENVSRVLRETEYKYALAGDMTYSPTGDVNCSNFIYSSSVNMWVLGITDIVSTLNETDYCDNIILYPNPSSGTINIEINDYRSSDNFSVSIYDINGSEVLNKDHCRSCGPMDVGNLSHGIYPIRIIWDGKIITKKLIIF